MSIEERIHTLQDESDRLFEEGDLEGALALAEEAHGLATEHRGDVSPDTLIDTLHQLAALLTEADAPDEALVLYGEIERLDPEDSELPLWRGIALMGMARFEDAEREIAEYLAGGSNPAEARWNLAILAEFRGDFAEAERLYGEASAEDPEGHPPPVRLSSDAVQRLLSSVIEGLPDPVRDALAEVVIQIEALPDPAMLRECAPEISPYVLGLHVGTAWGDESVFAQPQDLNRILVFQRNIERIAADEESLREELRITLLHEIGHHLGWDEDDLAERGLE